MKTMEIEVVSQIDGERRKAEKYVCEECDGTAFILFNIEGQDHARLGCIECWTSYCIGGECNAENNAQPVPPTNTG